MATDRIGIGHGVGEVAGALMSSGTKRKVEELGEHVVSAVVGGGVDRSMSAVVARYEARTSVDDQLDRLSTLAIMVHSAVEAAEGVHIRSWWLRRWLWKLRDAALDGDEVLQLFRQRRTSEETDAASRQATGNMAWRAIRSARSLVFGRGEDGAVERLSRVVARLEREAVGLGDFLKMLELEIRRPPPLQRPARPEISGPPAPVQVPPFGLLESRHNEIQECCWLESSVDEDSICYHSASPDGRDRSRFDHGVSSISHASVIRPIFPTPATPWPPASRALTPADTGRLASDFHRTGRANLDFHPNRSWPARWRNQLLSVPVPFQAQYHLLAGDRADVSGLMRWTAQNVETAAAHLEDFVTLSGFALASLERPSAQGQSQEIRMRARASTH